MPIKEVAQVGARLHEEQGIFLTSHCSSISSSSSKVKKIKSKDGKALQIWGEIHVSG
jgi:hypothetical protein